MSVPLRFTKMEGAGNDFVVLDGIRQRVELTPSQLRRLADRHFGVGCDQVLIVEASDRDGVDFRYRIFNSDGGEVEQCGNGARCFVRFVLDQGLTDKRSIRVETLGGVIEPRLETSGQVTVDMGPPRLTPRDVPFVATHAGSTHRFELEGETVELTVLSMGNPHAVQVVSRIENAPVTSQGPLLESHLRFPEGVNAGYMQVIDRATIRLRVWERGAGETLACGTGACAAVVAGILRGLVDSPARVETRGGALSVEWSGSDASVFITGPATTVFEGEWTPPREED